MAIRTHLLLLFLRDFSSAYSSTNSVLRSPKCGRLVAGIAGYGTPPSSELVAVERGIFDPELEKLLDDRYLVCKELMSDLDKKK